MTQATTSVQPVPVHGGLAAPVDRIVPRSAMESGSWTSLPKLEVDETDRTTLYRIADGTLSPLVGPMGEKDYRSVLETGAIERGGRRYAWTIPIVLPLTDAEAALARSKSELALAHGGTVFGRIQVDVKPADMIDYSFING